MRVAVLFFALVVAGQVAALSRVIQCSPRLFCNHAALEQWTRTKDVVKQLAHHPPPTLKVMGLNASRTELDDWRQRLCMDTSLTAFLAGEDGDIDESELSCIWPGSETSITCSPVPKKYQKEIYSYIPPEEMRKMVLKFRTLIHCPVQQEKGSQLVENQMTELIICNDRCIQAGVGYIASCLMMVVFSIAMLHMCVHD